VNSRAFARCRDITGARCCLDTGSLRACRRLVELDGIAIGIFNLDLFSPRADLDLIPDPRAGQFQLLDLRSEIVDVQNDPIPSAGLL